MVNRLIEPTAGRVLLDGEDVAHADPVQLRRRIGYVIQQVGLFPHRTVLENTATVPRLLGTDRARCRARAAELLDLVGLDPAVYGDRYPGQLSGGQQQRVGVARALAADPPVLLMDEPFGAVDPVVRERLQSEFLRLQAAVRKTVLFVTHDLEEAVRLGDRIAVFGPGRIEQLEAPAAVLGAPATPGVADFVGADRALKRLSVTPVGLGDLELPPVVRLDEPLERAGKLLEREGTGWAVVLDAWGRPHGWIAADRVSGPGTVRDRIRPMAPCLPAGASLREGLAALLRHDAGWIAVVADGAGAAETGNAPEPGRYLGVLTPGGLHRALRRSIGADTREEPRDGVSRAAPGAPHPDPRGAAGPRGDALG
jgi:osmoprotectant transport system ATP-binding protein